MDDSYIMMVGVLVFGIAFTALFLAVLGQNPNKYN